MNKNKNLQVRYTSDDEDKLVKIMKYLNKVNGVPLTKSAAICALINLKYKDIKKEIL